jgi:hypothetical protein
MLYTSTRTHTLHITWWDAFDIAQAVTMRQFTRKHVTDDLHILVTMFAKPLPCLNAILIDHPQITPAHKLGIAVTGKRKRVKAFQPAVIGIAAVLGFSESEHDKACLLHPETHVPDEFRHYRGTVIDTKRDPFEGWSE